MLFSSLLFVAALFGTALSATNLTVLLEFPPCATQCSSTELAIAQCPLSDLSQCLCTNETLQYAITACVLSTCNLTEQVVTSTLTQNEICNGVPKPSRANETIRDSIIIAAFTFPIIALRLISRMLIARRIWWDDWVVIVAAIFMVPNTFIPIYLSYHGFGMHVWDVPPLSQPLLLKLFYIAQVFYVMIQNLAKFSILLLYLRIFPDLKFRRIVQVCIVWQLCHTIAFLIGDLFQCVPVDSVWMPQRMGKCINFNAFSFAGAGLSIFEDIVITLLPISELKGLNLTLRKRIALCLMFALGSFACVTSMVRLKYLIPLGRSIDATWNDVDVVIWSQIESYMALICASLMCIRPLLTRYIPSLFPTTKGDSNSRSLQNPTWGQRVGSRLRNGIVNSELIDGDEENLADRRKKGDKWVTNSTMSYEMGSAGTATPTSEGRMDDLMDERIVIMPNTSNSEHPPINRIILDD